MLTRSLCRRALFLQLILIQCCVNEVIIASGNLRLNLMYVYVSVPGGGGRGGGGARQTRRVGIPINAVCRKHVFSSP